MVTTVTTADVGWVGSRASVHATSRAAAIMTRPSVKKERLRSWVSAKKGSSDRGSRRSPTKPITASWVAVKEPKLSYYIGETLLFTIYTHYGNLV